MDRASSISCDPRMYCTRSREIDRAGDGGDEGVSFQGKAVIPTRTTGERGPGRDSCTAARTEGDAPPENEFAQSAGFASCSMPPSVGWKPWC
jgi:hypothetical protein